MCLILPLKVPYKVHSSFSYCEVYFITYTVKIFCLNSLLKSLSLSCEILHPLSYYWSFFPNFQHDRKFVSYSIIEIFFASLRKVCFYYSTVKVYFITYIVKGSCLSLVLKSPLLHCEKLLSYSAVGVSSFGWWIS